MDPPYGEDRYAYQPAPLKLTTRSESITKGVVIIPPIRIEPAEAIKKDTNERLRNSVVKVSPKELTEKDADDKPEKDKNVTGKEDSKAEKRLSSDDQDRNNMKIEKLRKTASSSRPQSNEFSTLFFSPPRKDSSKDSGSSRRDSKLEQRKNTLEAVKTPIPLSRKDDKDKHKLGPNIDERTVSGKQISSAPILILSDAETGDSINQNRYPEILPNRSQDQRKIQLREEPTNASKTAVSTLLFPTEDKNDVKEHDSRQNSNQEEHTPMKHFSKDTADVTKQRRNMPSAQLSDILSSDVTESQQDDIVESVKGSLVMSPITEIIIPPTGKIIKLSQTDNMIKRKSESSGETRKHSSSQFVKNEAADPYNIPKESTLKVPANIEKLRGSGTIKAKLPTDDSKTMSTKNQIEAQQIKRPRISKELSGRTESVDNIKQPILISKENDDEKEALNASQNSILFAGHDLIDSDIQIPVTNTVGVNQLESKQDKKLSDQITIVDCAVPDDLLKDKRRSSKSPNLTNISVKANNENTQLQSDRPKKESHVVTQNRDSNVSGYKTVADDEIKMQPQQLLKEEFKYSAQLQEYHKTPDQDILAEDLQTSQPPQSNITEDSPKAKYDKMDDNQKRYPSTILDTKITEAHDMNEQQLFEPKQGKHFEEKSPRLLNDSQLSTKGGNRDDPHYINLVFQKYTHDNKTGIKTLDADANFEPDENIVTYKSNSPAQDKRITIPIDGQNVMAIKIKKSSSKGDNELLAPHSYVRKYLDTDK